MVLIISKHSAVFFKNNPTDKGLPLLFFEALVKTVVEPSFFHTMEGCEWDKAMLTITTPENR